MSVKYVHGAFWLSNHKIAGDSVSLNVLSLEWKVAYKVYDNQNKQKI